ncbi:MAG: Asp-tRNA(Asn)/Glu-tRNA(Gln) amidotransferase subunit GatB [Candidatus Lokiarchaeota archaeon]|nr:Asp-tRNA(Asn)/Glu-tRNA(Gln) amidotransferase subunit GatB [Candidatus Lokiarchaeota archaeon]
MSKYEGVVIGLEVHVQLTELKTKLFCGCSSDYRGKEANTLVCPICLGLPGSLPVTNEKAIEFATSLALALKCDINKQFYFFRKNYYYPDLPKGFQISQYNKAGGKAFADGGVVSIRINDDNKDIHLNRIHLEEDPARIVHEGSIATSPYALVDYNRSGTTLIEIVSEPDMRTPAEAREYLKQLISLVQYTGICDPALEGAFRVDANVSFKGNERAEIKNINSIREVEAALEYEIGLQKRRVGKGETLKQETKHWDGTKTIPLRSKEFEADYKYFPEQDLVPFEINDSYIDKARKKLPEMPDQRKVRYQEEFQLSEFDAGILVLDKQIADFFEKGVKLNESFGPEEYKLYCNWLMNDISGWLNENTKKINETSLRPKQLVDLINFIKDGKITGKIAKTFVPKMMDGNDIEEIVKETGKQAISDESVLEKTVLQVIKENPKIVEDCKKNMKAKKALIGRVMAKTKGQANPQKTEEIIDSKLKEMGII